MSRCLDRHTDWCAQGHHCTFGEHRGMPIRVDITGAGSMVVTRVRGTDGSEWAEVRASVRLQPHRSRAEQQLGGLVDGLARMMGRLRLR
jgi:hypothetical protein